MLAFVGGLDAAGFESSEQRVVLLRPGTPKERRIGGQANLMAYGLPQFFFRVTTAYNLKLARKILWGRIEGK